MKYDRNLDRPLEYKLTEKLLDLFKRKNMFAWLVILVQEGGKICVIRNIPVSQKMVHLNKKFKY